MDIQMAAYMANPRVVTLADGTQRVISYGEYISKRKRTHEQHAASERALERLETLKGMAALTGMMMCFVGILILWFEGVI